MNDRIPEGQETTDPPVLPKPAIGLVADFCAHGDPDRPSPRDGKFIQVNRKTLSSFFRSTCSSLRFQIPNLLTGEGSLGVHLTILELRDFDGRRVTEQIEPLRRLAQVRERLSQVLDVGPHRDVLNWILGDSILAHVITTTFHASMAAIHTDEIFLSNVKRLEPLLSDSQRACWILAQETEGVREMLPAIVSVVCLVSLPVANVRYSSLPHSIDSLDWIDSLIREVIAQCDRRIEEQVRTVQTNLSFRALKRAWQGLVSLTQVGNAMVLNIGPREGRLGRLRVQKRWNRYPIVPTCPKTVCWIDRIAMGHPPMFCLFLDCGAVEPWARLGALRDFQSAVEQLHIPLVCAMPTPMFDRWRDHESIDIVHGTDDEETGHDEDAALGRFSKEECSRFIIAIRDSELHAGDCSNSDANVEQRSNTMTNSVYARVIELTREIKKGYNSMGADCCVPGGEHIRELPGEALGIYVSSYYRSHSGLGNDQALANLFSISRVVQLCRRVAIVEETQDAGNLEREILKSFERDRMAKDGSGIGNSRDSLRPTVIVSRDEEHGSRFQCTVTLPAIQMQHTFSVHRHTWLP